MMWVQAFIQFREDETEATYEVGAYCYQEEGRCYVGEPQVSRPNERLDDGGQARRPVGKVPGWDTEVEDLLAELYWRNASEDHPERSW